MTSNRDIWFPAKRWGWGWGPPVKWQGWVVLLAYGVLVTVGSIYLLLEVSTTAYAVYLAALTAALLAICWWKGERPRWRWGGDVAQDDDGDAGERGDPPDSIRPG